MWWAWLCTALALSVRGWCDGEQLNETPLDAETPGRCRRECASHPACTHATWDEATGFCFLLRGCPRLISDYPRLHIEQVRG